VGLDDVDYIATAAVLKEVEVFETVDESFVVNKFSVKKKN